MTYKSRRAGVRLAGVVIALLVGAGCGGGGRQEFRLSNLGFSMELPAGWKQGEPRVMGGFRSTSSGTFFFEDRGKDLPSGSITVFPREGENLKAHVDKVIEQEKAMTGMFKSLTGTLGKMAGGEVEREARKAQEALESEIMSPAEIAIGGGTAYGVAFKTSDVATYRVFVEKGSEVIEIIFQTEAPDFPSYEAAFKAAAATIKIE